MKVKQFEMDAHGEFVEKDDATLALEADAWRLSREDPTQLVDGKRYGGVRWCASCASLHGWAYLCEDYDDATRAVVRDESKDAPSFVDAIVRFLSKHRSGDI